MCMVRSNTVPNFLPSTRGLQFANRFPPGPTVKFGPLDPRWIGIGDASSGLCGGMSWLVRERFDGDLPIQPDTEPPANGSPLFAAIVRRQVRSLDWLRLPFRIWRMAAAGPGRAARDTVDREWPRIRDEIDAGRPSMVALVRQTGWNPLGLTMNHQVLAYAYDEGPEAIVVRIYDPNWPRRDDVSLRVRLSATGGAPSPDGQSTGEPLAGFLAAPYRR